MNKPFRRHHTKADLMEIAAVAMRERGLAPDFSPQALQELKQIVSAQHGFDAGCADLRELLWCSIDNDDSLDLDQLSASALLPHGAVKIWVAVADVDLLVRKDSALDQHAQCNTVSVYTSARIFPMLPPELSTNLSSLNQNQDRQALVTEMVFDAAGAVQSATVYLALVRNKAKLAYDAVSAWIDGKGPLPDAAQRIQGMDEQLRTQDQLAQRLRQRRHTQGSLEFETLQPKASFDGEQVVGLEQQVQNRGRQLIEELMIATNIAVAQFLRDHHLPSLRRVVRSPERWARIVAVAAQYNVPLPEKPDSKALEDFLAERRRQDPLRFPDLSLVIVKLMGSGEYVLEKPGADAIGHFGLAVHDYTHSTAPNRRYPDVITLRMVKSVLHNKPLPYSAGELDSLAEHCTAQEDAARKVERQLRKSEAAMLLESRIGQQFDAVVTGRTAAATWVRIFNPPTEGMLLSNPSGLDVGAKLKVKLVSTQVERGFIDFAPVLS